MIQNNFPSPKTCPDYIAMTTAAKLTKQPLQEVRGILPEKKRCPVDGQHVKKEHP